MKQQAFGNLIGGSWRSSDETIANVNPSDTSDIIGHYAVATADDVRAAVERAHEAGRAWFAATPQNRADRLDAIGDEISKRVDELARQLSREEGKTLRESRAEVTKAAQLFKYSAGEAIRLSGGALPPFGRPSTSTSNAVHWASSH